MGCRTDCQTIQGSSQGRRVDHGPPEGAGRTGNHGARFAHPSSSSRMPMWMLRCRARSSVHFLIPGRFVRRPAGSISMILSMMTLPSNLPTPPKPCVMAIPWTWRRPLVRWAMPRTGTKLKLISRMPRLSVPNCCWAENALKPATPICGSYRTGRESVVWHS